jgi:hypothetical protein
MVIDETWKKYDDLFNMNFVQFFIIIKYKNCHNYKFRLRKHVINDGITEILQ